MPFDGDKVEGLLAVIRELNQKVILVGKALKPPDTMNSLDPVWIESHVRHVDNLPYAWLLPYCSVMVCHGGAGVVHAALRAGNSIVVSPLMGDQFTFARLLEAKGLGAQAGQGNLNSMTIDEFRTGLRKALNCTDAAASVGKRIQQKGEGVKKLVDILSGKEIART
jgi:UDP:flavonoid glycosyltransferase YjiC (YdhE family)